MSNVMHACLKKIWIALFAVFISIFSAQLFSPRVCFSSEAEQDRLLQDLTSGDVFVDTEEDVQLVTEYVCQNGHVHNEKGDLGKCGVCGLGLKEVIHGKKLSRRENISERIEYLTEEIAEKRFLFGISSTGILQQILHGYGGHGFTAEGSVDLLFIYRPFGNMTLFLDLEGIGGNGPDEYIDSISGLNDDAGDFQEENGGERLSVREAWCELGFFKNQLTLVMGKIDLTNYFDSNAVANDETTQFITSVFVNNATLEVPVNGPGIASTYEFGGGVYFGLGLQSSDDVESGRTHGMYGIGEMGINSYKLFNLEGNLRFWGKMNEGQANNKGLGISIDQQISESVFAFVRYGINERDGAEVKSAWSSGLEMHHPVNSRQDDKTSLAFGRTKAVNGSEEFVTEMYYKFVINKHFSITPSIQTIFDPVGLDDRDVVTLMGLRTQLEF
ncbi:MAG: carbohydrate porin [Planctomycetes bacterium]|nr:carbohydrate porin [Planctomycetota bacterium]